MNLLDGKKLSEKLLTELKNKIKKENIRPKFVSILVGNNQASLVYLRNKKTKCEEVGISFELRDFNNAITQEDLIKEINKINNDITIHGCIIQLPLPKHIDTNLILDTLDSTKDVDCFHTSNIGKLLNENTCFYPATPMGITLLLKEYNIETKGKHCVIIGKSKIVGSTLGLMLSNENTFASTVTLCDKYTENIRDIVKTADILVVASGKHHLIDNTFTFKNNLVIFDVGIHRIKDETKKKGYKLEGDVCFKDVNDKVSYITPVPGGVGPMTVYCLLENIYNSYEDEDTILQSICSYIPEEL